MNQLCGARGEIRTLDQRIKSPLLYHWATRAYWQEIKDSNSNLSGWSRVFYH